MNNLSDMLSYYKSLSLSKKISFFDSNGHGNFQKLQERDLSKFLKSVILNDDENPYLRKQAIEIHTEYVLIQRLKSRYELTILIDDWTNPQDVHLEIRRQKDLFLFYEEEPDDIEEIYKNGTKYDEVEIQSEAYFHLGLITLFKALKSDRNNSLEFFNISCEHFENSAKIIENRKDAEFFQIVALLLIDLLNGSNEGVHYKLRLLTNILWQREAFSTSEITYPFEIGFYRILFSMSKIQQSRPSSWLDYRNELGNLYYYYSEIKNAELKERLSKSTLHSEFIRFSREGFIEPYFAINLSADLERINSLLNELEDSSTGKYIFLEYLKEVIENKQIKKKPMKNQYGTV